MHLSKPLRILVLGFMGLLLGAIAWSFHSRRPQGVTLPQAQILSPEVSRQSTRFEYTESRRGKLSFRVQARTSTETVDHLHRLEQVALSSFDDEGNLSETVRGEEALYNIGARRIDFSGNVTVRLADFTQLFSQKVEADLGREIITIREGFSFRRSGLQGRGKRLVYHVRSRRLRMMEGLELRIGEGPEPLRARARSGAYDLEAGRIELEGGARVEGSGSRLRARRIWVLLTEEERLRDLEAVGEASFEDGARGISGERIHAYFEGTTGLLDHFEVITPGKGRARLEQRGATGYSVEAAKIVGRMAGSDRGGRALEAFSAQGRVRLASSRLRLGDTFADRARGTFWKGTDSLRHLWLEGRVKVSRPLGASRGRERLRCQRLELTVLPGDRIQESHASGQVRLEVERPVGFRRVEAREIVNRYQDGVLQRTTARGGCRVEAREEGRETTLEAPRISLTYQGGALAGAEAGQGTRMRISEAGTVRTTRAAHLSLRYRQGRLLSAVQSGNFELEEPQPGAMHLKAAKARYLPASDRVVFEGGSPELRFSEVGGGSLVTGARRFELERASGRIRALGKVESRVKGEGEDLIISAGRMATQPGKGWIDYWSLPRIIQGGGSITGRRVRYHQKEGRLVVDGDVSSYLVARSKKARGGYQVRARKLTVRRQPRRALYQGAVVVHTQGFALWSPEVEFEFEGKTGAISRMVARERVRIETGSRRVEGEHAIYFPGDDKVLVVGRPARAREADQGIVRGERMIFFVGQDRLLVEGGRGAPGRQPE